MTGGELVPTERWTVIGLSFDQDNQCFPLVTYIDGERQSAYFPGRLRDGNVIQTLLGARAPNGPFALPVAPHITRVCTNFPGPVLLKVKPRARSLP
jgi:hypothetical protein